MEQTSELTECLVCKSNDLHILIDLGWQPPANAFVKNATDRIKNNPLYLNYCGECTHVQLGWTVDPEVLFKDYKYVSGTTSTLNRHFYRLAEDYSRSKGLNTLDIGCNDGSLLEAFISRGANGYGVDPAENLATVTSSKGIPVLVDYWNKEAPGKLQAAFGIKEFDVITVLNCLGHNSNPREFLRACLDVMGPKNRGPKLLIEFPSFISTIELLDFGQIYHEHVSYFTPYSLGRLLGEVDPQREFEICMHRLFPGIHGGTLRTLVSHVDSHYRVLPASLMYSKSEILEMYKSFQERFNHLIERLSGALLACSVDNKVVAYGASAKSSTLFNLSTAVNLAKCVSYVVDDSSYKQGLYCPGSGLRIDSPGSLLEEDPEKLVILVTAHNFKSEIAKRLLDKRLGEAKLLSYTPDIKLEKVKDACNSL